MKRCILLVCLLMLSMGCACAYEYISDADVSFHEPFGEQPVNTQPGFSYTSDRALYLFSSEIPEYVRDQFIIRQEALMGQLDASGLTICILPDYEPWVISERKQLFLSPDDETGMTQAIATLQALYGEYCHYGLIYGTADGICKAAALSGHEARYNDKGMLRFYNNESNLSAFMLLYPSFTDLLAMDSIDLAAFTYESDLEDLQPREALETCRANTDGWDEDEIYIVYNELAPVLGAKSGFTQLSFCAGIVEITG